MLPFNMVEYTQIAFVYMGGSYIQILYVKNAVRWLNIYLKLTNGKEHCNFPILMTAAV